MSRRFERPNGAPPDKVRIIDGGVDGSGDIGTGKGPYVVLVDGSLKTSGHLQLGILLGDANTFSTGIALMFAYFVANVALAKTRGVPLQLLGVADGEEKSDRPGRLFRILEYTLGFLNRLFAGLFVVNVGLYFIVILLTATLADMALLLPLMPQSLGGSAPRCARFDVDTASLSPALASVQVRPGAASDSKAETRPVRTRPVWVYHSDREFVLFKLAGLVPTPYGSRDTYELRRSAIHAVVWCSDIDQP